MNLLILWMCAAALVPATDDPGLAKLFQERNLEGVMIISSLDGRTEYVHNVAKADVRRPPASTFKIPNALMALDAGAVSDAETVIPWDGTQYGIPEWNRDQTLRTAMKDSCVWAFQELARRIGAKRYAAYAKVLDYGNGEFGPGVDDFWLQGDLAISPREQVDFLKRLVRRELPFKDAHVDLLRDILVREGTRRYTLRAKTGSTVRIPVHYGWYVGWVRTDAEVWVFATCFTVKDPARDLPQREALTRAGLQLKGII